MVVNENSPKRGEVWLVDFDPTKGAEIRKTRPALILQNDAGNVFSPLTIVAAITSQVDVKRFPIAVPIPLSEGGLVHRSLVLLNQIRTIDKKTQLIKRLGCVSVQTMEHVNHSLSISLGLPL